MPLGLIYRGGKKGQLPSCPPRWERDRRERKGRMGTCLLEYAIQTRFTYGRCHRRHTGIPDDPRGTRLRQLPRLRGPRSRGQIPRSRGASGRNSAAPGPSGVGNTSGRRQLRAAPPRHGPRGGRRSSGGAPEAKPVRSRPAKEWASRRAAKLRRPSVGEVGAEPPRRGVGLEAGGASGPPRRGDSLEAGGEQRRSSCAVCCDSHCSPCT